MKKKTFITLFIIFHCVFIIVQIHKQSMFVKASYEKQRLAREYKELMAQLEDLEQHLALLQNPEHIKKFAQDHSAMRSVVYKQIKMLSS